VSTLTQTEIAARNHRRAVRFFWSLLIGATTISLIGNVAHRAKYVPKAPLAHNGERPGHGKRNEIADIPYGDSDRIYDRDLRA
jgi:hypothetical protein